MKYFFPFPVYLGIALIFMQCQNQVVREERYPNGQLRRSISLVKNPNGKFSKHGPMKSWYPNGNPESEFTYSHGQMEGEAKTWYLNGQIQFEGAYQEGYLVREKKWGEDGRITVNRDYRIVSTQFEGGAATSSHQLREKYTVLKADNSSLIKFGTYRSWFPNGQLEKILEYFEGKKDGFSKEWFSNGNLKSQGHYQKGKKEGPWSYAYEDGKIQYKILYRHDKKDGPFAWWYPNGKLREEAEFTNDSLDGVVVRFYPTGNKESETGYQGGYKQGEARTWYENGTEKIHENWNRGGRTGVFKEWDKNGNLKKEQSWKNNLPHGLSREWYPGGGPFIEANYVEGKLAGAFKWWTEKGDLISEQQYTNGVLIFDSRVAKMKKILEATEVEIPIRFMGFQWGMSPEEIKANIRKLEGKLTQEIPGEITFSLPARHGSQSAQIVGRAGLNSWDELWEIKMDFPIQEGVKFSGFTQFVEQELQFKLGLPKYTKDFKDLPGMLEKERSWGTFFIEEKRPPYTKNQFATIKAHAFAYENQNWNTFILSNFLIREYASGGEVQLSGPFYDAVTQ